MNTIQHENKRSEAKMASMFIVGSALKIAASLGIGIGASSMFTYFHNFEFKTKKKGDKDDNYSESLRQRAKSLS